MRYLKITALFLALALVVPLSVQASLEIDGKISVTNASVENIMANKLYRITDIDPSTLKLPDTIPQDMLDKIEDRMNSVSYASSMYYIDLETGFTISYNSGRYFRGASLVKAPYMMTVLDKINSGALSLSEEYTYTSSFDRTGTVQISKDCSHGDSLTLERLIEYLIYYSDNTAFSMLLSNTVSISGFQDYGRSHWGAEFYKGGTNWLTSYGVAKAFEDLYFKAKSGNRLYVWFVELMKQANENKFINYGIPEDENGNRKYQVAHKYGMDINSSNDAAIVYYGERPYVLVVLTDYVGQSTQGFINNISSDIFDIHEFICSHSA